jgi:hypothetical protein
MFDDAAREPRPVFRVNGTRNACRNVLSSIRIVRLRVSWDRTNRESPCDLSVVLQDHSTPSKADHRRPRGKFLSTIDLHRAASFKNARTENVFVECAHQQARRYERDNLIQKESGAA